MSVSSADLWDAIVANGLGTAEEAAALRARFSAENAAADGDTLLQWLTKEEALTEYQSEILAKRSKQPLKVGPYLILSRIESGRLEDIYRARHAELRFPVCLKLLTPRGTPGEIQGQLARFQREARVSLQADHPHLVRTFQIGQVGETYFIAFENLQGQSLMELLNADSIISGSAMDDTAIDDSGELSISDLDHALTEDQPVETESQLQQAEMTKKLMDSRRGESRPCEVCREIREAALALACLHDREILHRDVTPDNLWITPAGHVKLMDFGLARDGLSFLDSRLSDRLMTGASGFLGNTDYLSPEQAVESEAATPASDLYSLGCTLYRMLTGRVPYTAATPAKQMILHAIQTPPAPSTLNRQVPKALDDVVARMMAKQPGDRYPSAKVVAEVLEAFLDPDEPLSFESSSTPELLVFLRWLDQGATYQEPTLVTEADFPEEEAGA